MEQHKKNFKIVTSKRTRVILPNIFTLVGVCIGLSSIKFAFDGRFEISILAIIIAAIIDGLDGRIARLIKGASKVGKELDSLTDVISFGVAPAFIMYFWKLNELGRVGWLICLIYVICVALRLARFNVTSEAEPSWRDNFFEGVPSPAAAGLVLLPLILNLSGLIKFENFTALTITAILITSILMVSKVPTYSLKRILIPRNLAIFLLLGLGIYVSLLIFYTFETLFLTGLAYLLLIPISFFHYRQNNKKNFNNSTLEEDEDEDVL